VPVIKPDKQSYDSAKSSKHQHNKVEANSILSASIGIRWQGQDCTFTDWSFLPSINLRCDFLPAEIKEKLPGLVKGDEIIQRFRAGEILEGWSSTPLQTISASQFQPPWKDLSPVVPLLGRYYPKDFFRDVQGVNKGNKFPCRITCIENNQLTVDLNHPLATKPLEMLLNIDSIKKVGAEDGGRCNDIAAIACDHGPGMQDSLPGNETDFWSGNPFSRLDSGNDGQFFKRPALTPFWDSKALQLVSNLYNKLIPSQSRVLDLMAGVHSPLQQSDIETSSIICAGLNQEELDNNPLCSEKTVLDVNSISRLPYPDESFDIVLIHAAIEYVINPKLLFCEISRVLKPSGRIIISFSNRSITEKSIQLWRDAHEFERPAIVLSYLRSAGYFDNFNSYSKRGLFRPSDDKLADRLLLSDPVYVIWADKIRLY